MGRDGNRMDPTQAMVGTCLTCGNVLHCFYAECSKSRGILDDLPRAECPICKERSPSKQGASVQMVKVRV